MEEDLKKVVKNHIQNSTEELENLLIDECEVDRSDAQDLLRWFSEQRSNFFLSTLALTNPSYSTCSIVTKSNILCIKFFPSVRKFSVLQSNFLTKVVNQLISQSRISCVCCGDLLWIVFYVLHDFEDNRAYEKRFLFKITNCFYFWSFYPFWTLVPYFCSILLIFFENFENEVVQLHFVCFPLHFWWPSLQFWSTLWTWEKSTKMKLGNFNFKIFKKYNKNAKKVGYQH